MTRTRIHWPLIPLLALPALLGVAACSTNPATGRQQLNLYSEEQEVALGRRYHEDVTRQIGLYDDPELASYVDRLGKRLAARSERPQLPWHFGVVDDAAVNAFALPGGFIYVTRGLLGHVGSEAELASVLGHEIGHVTARHQVNQMSKQQLTQVGLTLGMILSPEARRYGDLANLAGGLLFLKFGRDDERQADDLGLRYLQAGGYPPAAMEEVFGLLARVSAAEGQGRLPGWLATHPDPEERGRRVAQGAGGAASGGELGRERYLAEIDGLVYGPDPREGFFRDGVFHHPTLRFRIAGPQGWRGVNQKQAVVWQAPQGDGLFALTLAAEDDPRSAAQRFFAQQGVSAVGELPALPRGMAAAGAEFAAQTQQGELLGAVGFFTHGDAVYQLIGFAPQAAWRRHGNEVARALASFATERDAEVLAAQPMRVELVRVPSAMTLAELDRRFPSTVPLERVALLNNLDADSRLAAGERVKRVVGGPRGGMDL
jgi:predicted Zn-dependent protease